MNPIDYVVLAAILILAFFAGRYAFRHRHDPCDGNCSSCPYHEACKRKEKR